MIGKLLCRFGWHDMDIEGDWYVCHRCGLRKLTEEGIEDLHYRIWMADESTENRKRLKLAEIREKKILDGIRLRARALLAERGKLEITDDTYDAAMIRIDELNFGRGVEITEEETKELDNLINAVMRYEAKLTGETEEEVR